MNSDNKKVSLNTTIRKSVLDGFRDFCKKSNVNMNTLIEVFMQQCVDGELKIAIKRLEEV